MSEKNSDVDRAVAAVGGMRLDYHSFGPFVLRPRTTGNSRAFTYNEFGEPEYLAPQAAAPLQIAPAAAPPAMASVDPLYDALPVVQPPMNRPAPPLSPSRQPVRPPQTLRPQPSVYQPQSLPAQPLPPQPLPPQVGPQPMAAPVMQAPPMQAPPSPAPTPAPPPFFPLLAAALPSATEPSYMPVHAPASPVEPVYVGAQAQPAMAGSNDHRSLAEMFNLLAGRAAASPGGVPTAASLGFGPQPAAAAPASGSAPAEGQALFRRI